MDVRRLRILREFADRGTVGEVADAMRLTPSAVSQQLKVLVREAGVPLLRQDGRGIALTEAGRALVLRADEVIAAVDRAAEEMVAYREGTQPVVRIASFPSGGSLLLPRLVAAVEGVVDVRPGDEDVPYSEAPGLLTEYDIVVTHRDERAAALRSARVWSMTLMREPIDLLVHNDHPLAGRGSVTPGELADETWISVPEGFPVDDVLVSLGVSAGIRPRVRFRFKDFQIVEDMVAHGHGIALMPRYVSRSPRVARLVIREVRAGRLYEVLARPGAQHRPAIAAAIRGLQDAAAVLESQ
ncbi:HTH-type transcriptional regulator GltC [Mycobacteroides salmoniphilum]|uniref:HTH-type transcriptional regulator GltC n=1 Tax=Mycobacteroides salmoniphilum TaxID=404941 RepID=A0A4R8S1K9_9MYCO|nr:LysR family transcriptional regulator [Mycobacteroides salmoniphilum]TDZ77250.1 HTH-type transcriptional regulator GltC [Mycobacteroides salmoniphilum]